MLNCNLKVKNQSYTLFFVLLFLVLFSFVFSPVISFADGNSGVDYALPYPGILPGSSFYFLKGVRDRVMGFFISSPLKKAEYELLQSDKRVAAAYLLLSHHPSRVALSESTFSKGENYFEDAISRVSEAKRQGMDTGELITRLTLANGKYLEELHNMEKMTSGEDRERFVRLEERTHRLGKRVTGM